MVLQSLQFTNCSHYWVWSWASTQEWNGKSWSWNKGKVSKKITALYCTMETCMYICTVTAKKRWRFRSILPRPDGITPFMLAIPFRSIYMYMHVQLVIMGMVYWSVKWKASSFTCQLESIVLYCRHFLKSSGAVLYCRSLILGEFCDRGSTRIEVGYRQSIDLALPINSNRLQMRLLG